MHLPGPEAQDYRLPSPTPGPAKEESEFPASWKKALGTAAFNAEDGDAGAQC